MNNFGVIDMVRLLDESNLGKAGAKDLENFYHQQQRELAPLLTALKSKTRRPEQEERKMQEQLREAEAKLEARRGELRDGLLKKAEPLIQQIAKEKGFAFVLARPQAMVYVKPEMDMTTAVMELLNKMATA